VRPSRMYAHSSTSLFLFLSFPTLLLFAVFFSQSFFLSLIFAACDVTMDYTWTYGPCNDAEGTRVKSYQWMSPGACDSSFSSLPDDETVECGNLLLIHISFRLSLLSLSSSSPSPADYSGCGPGTYANDEGGCSYCAINLVSNGQDEYCSPCAEGYAPSDPIQYISNWTVFPSGFTSSCTDECYTEYLSFFFFSSSITFF
jgi:hypothetical protein